MKESNGNKIHPISEPVKGDFRALIRAVKVLNKKKVDFTLIVNPQAGQKPIKTTSILHKLIDDSFNKHKNLSIGYILHAGSKLTDLITLIKKYGTFTFSILHYGFPNGKEAANAIKAYDNIKRHVFIDGYAGKLYQRHLKKEGIDRLLPQFCT